MVTKTDLQAFADTLGPEPPTTAEQAADGENGQTTGAGIGGGADNPLPPSCARPGMPTWSTASGITRRCSAARSTLSCAPTTSPWSCMWRYLSSVSAFSPAPSTWGSGIPKSVAAIAFGGLSVGSFLLFFIRQPLQALEENLEFITWLGVAFNTYWTRLMYLTRSKACRPT